MRRPLRNWLRRVKERRRRPQPVIPPAPHGPNVIEKTFWNAIIKLVMFLVKKFLESRLIKENPPRKARVY